MSFTKNKLSNIHGKIFQVVRGVEGECLVLGDDDGGDRISGPKPWGGGTVVKTFEVDEEYGPIELLEDENAELRELCAYMMRHKEALPYGLYLEVHDRMRELGIEVGK